MRHAGAPGQRPGSLARAATRRPRPSPAPGPCPPPGPAGTAACPRRLTGTRGRRWRMSRNTLAVSLERASRAARTAPRGGHSAARCGNAFLCWPRNPLEFTTSPGRGSGPETTGGRSSVGRAQPCQGEGREFEPRRPLEVRGSSRTPHSWWSGREARQRPAKPSTRVQIPSPPPRTISSAGERFPDTEEVTGSIPVSSTGSATGPGSTRAISSAGERFPDTEEVTGSIPVSRTRSTQRGRRRACIPDD